MTGYFICGKCAASWYPNGGTSEAGDCPVCAATKELRAEIVRLRGHIREISKQAVDLSVNGPIYLSRAIQAAEGYERELTTRAAEEGDHE